MREGPFYIVLKLERLDWPPLNYMKGMNMTRHRPRAVLLLFLVLNLTACQTWQSISLGPVTPGRFIEIDQPDRVRVTGRGVLEQEVERPAVDGDRLVGLGDFSIPLEDILRLEVRGISVSNTILSGVGLYTLIAAIALASGVDN